MTARLSLSLLLATVVTALSLSVAQAEEVYTSEDTLAAIDQYSAEFNVPHAWLYRVIRCETGGTFNPYSVGRQGELGAAQLHPRGELLRFYAWQYNDPFSPWQSVRFLAQEYGYGRGSQWSCAR